jgi:hypothetical protein
LKNLLICFVILAFISCKKDETIQIPDCQAVTYYLDSYDDNWKFLNTMVSYHQCKVCDADLQRFRTYEKVGQLCGENKLMRLVIGKDTCKIKS